MKNIQQSIIAAMRMAAEKGIAKRMRADLGGAKVNYRGIEDAMNEMCSVLVLAGITVTPDYSDLQIVERAKGEGKATRFVTLKGSFTFEAEDRSSVKAVFYGEAMDSGDKATIKAQSVAFRTALFQTFCVPTVATAIDPEAGGEAEGPGEAALAAAEQGLTAYQHYWSKLSAEDKKALAPHHAELKAIAQEADSKVPA